jgi:hypothetical protein
MERGAQGKTLRRARRNVLFGRCRSWLHCNSYVQSRTRLEGFGLPWRDIITESTTDVKNRKRHHFTSRKNAPRCDPSWRSYGNDWKRIMVNALKLLRVPGRWFQGQGSAYLRQLHVVSCAREDCYYDVLRVLTFSISPINAWGVSALASWMQTRTVSSPETPRGPPHPHDDEEEKSGMKFIMNR